MTLWGNDAVPVWVEKVWRSPKGGLPLPYRIEALMWPDVKHPAGKDHLVRVSYLYSPFNGWVRKDRVTPR